MDVQKLISFKSKLEECVLWAERELKNPSSLFPTYMDNLKGQAMVLRDVLGLFNATFRECFHEYVIECYFESEPYYYNVNGNWDMDVEKATKFTDIWEAKKCLREKLFNVGRVRNTREE